MNRIRRHLGLIALLACAAPLTVAFCWHGEISTVSDDSVSYITLARWIWPFPPDSLSAQWIHYYSHFPPLFALLLGITGGAWNFFLAHMVVAACAVLVIPFVYSYGTLRLGSPRAGLTLAIVFLFLPSAWISAEGILSEPLYLVASLAAIVYHVRREQAQGDEGAMTLGLLLAAACLTRAAGVALLAAYAVHLAIRAHRQRVGLRALLPLAVPVALQLAWMAARPAVQSKGYLLDLDIIMQSWMYRPAEALSAAWHSLWGGWIASFMADSSEPFAIGALLGIVAALGLAGAVRGAMRNRLDSWYVIASVAMLAIWLYAEDNQRRLLYPLLPLLLSHAAEMLGAITGRLRGLRYQRYAMLAGAAFVVVLSAPAILLVAHKAMDREPLVPGFEYSRSATTTYYTIVNVGLAQAMAFREAAVLSGLQAIERVTPPGSRVMWMRPEYVAILGRREPVPWYYWWDRATLARQIADTGTTHVVVGRLFKSDLSGREGDAFAALAIDTPAYLRPGFAIVNPGDGTLEFVLLEVDRDALKSTLAALR